MARPDPLRPDFLSALDAAPAHGSPIPELEAELRQHIMDALPPGVPTCFRRVIHAARSADTNTICALVQVFDGEVHNVQVRGGREDFREYRWPGLRVPFGWDVKRQRWRRYPERRRDTS